MSGTHGPAGWTPPPGLAEILDDGEHVPTGGEDPERVKVLNDAVRDAQTLLSWAGWPRTPFPVTLALAERAASTLVEALYGDNDAAGTAALYRGDAQ